MQVKFHFKLDFQIFILPKFTNLSYNLTSKFVFECSVVLECLRLVRVLMTWMVPRLKSNSLAGAI